MTKQLSLVSTWQKDRFAFGGAALKNSHAKGKRPFSKKLPVHVVMRSSKATGPLSLMKHNSEIQDALYSEASRNHVKLHAVANAGNHLHLLVQAPAREALSGFLRAVSGRIAMIVTGARKGNALAFIGSSQKVSIESRNERSGFWDQRPFTRLVSLGRDFQNVCRYVTMNSTESFGRFSRDNARRMFAQIRESIRRSEIPISPGLRAAGFC